MVVSTELFGFVWVVYMFVSTEPFGSVWTVFVCTELFCLHVIFVFL